MAGHGDYIKGTMDLREHRDTYALFWGLTKWGLIAVALALALMGYFLT